MFLEEASSGFFGLSSSKEEGLTKMMLAACLVTRHKLNIVEELELKARVVFAVSFLNGKSRT